MNDPLFEYLFVAGLVVAEVIRFPHRMRNKRDRRQGKIAEGRVDALEFILSTAGWIGLELLPLFYVFTDWLDFANYELPVWAGVLGALAFALGLWVVWRAHADLGRNWSPTLEVVEGHTLVTHGIYGVIRHPIYASLWLWGLGQALMLENWLAGFAGLVSALLIHLLRVPREERMMVEQFGDEYRGYRQRTGGIFPRLSR